MISKTHAVSAPAQAVNAVTAPLASDVTTAQQVAAFWLADGGANLKNATPYAVQTYFDGEFYGVYSAAKNLWSGSIA
ncbi:hypothetical protein N5079_04880 [Planotetraspora sp. A-T 1434]|uniref:hypothetical protein n=1 Tax=Planotetraspora sp. A-T 1434 TaxID=2979219 RepID=UPI0021BF1F57|nr:hypothetical protein [Planotetraspora sp. A-T 1434]MCT9929552.1 hypothetical protein [Planotetraspora sp. A-T 1434]